MTSAASPAPKSSEIASSGEKTSVSVVGKSRLAKTRAGVRASATCSDEFTITAIAKSGLLRAASWTPTTFSTAFPAIATTTSPAKVWLMCKISIAGWSALTNQSLTSAAAVAVEPRTTSVVTSDQRGRSCGASPGSVWSRPGSVNRKTASRTPAQIRLSVFSCACASV